YTFVTYNHGPVDSLHENWDNIIYVKRFLEHLDRDIRISPFPEKGRINIFIERFNHHDLNLLMSDYEYKCIFMITEQITGDTFNLFDKKKDIKEEDSPMGGNMFVKKNMSPAEVNKMSHPHKDKPIHEKYHKWKSRLDNFKRISKRCFALWALAPQLQKDYGKIIQHIPVLTVPRVYIRNELLGSAFERSIDVSFCGNLTASRKELIEKIQNLPNIKIKLSKPKETSAEERDEIIRTSKLHLDLKLGPKSQIPSTSRIHNALCLDTLVLCEKVDPGHEIDTYTVKFETPDELLNLVKYYVQNNEAREKQRKDLVEKFKEDTAQGKDADCKINPLKQLIMATEQLYNN
ncbi:hypothetical protein N9V13_00005, partial [Betaproteobacteria bacterium]|nr:hypothetical protein [Betaproteobacteria bacterium]